MALDKSHARTKDRMPPCSHLGLSLFSRRVMVSPISLRPGQNFESFRDFEGQNQGNPGGGSTNDVVL